MSVLGIYFIDFPISALTKESSGDYVLFAFTSLHIRRGIRTEKAQRHCENGGQEEKGDINLLLMLNKGSQDWFLRDLGMINQRGLW
jgi:hypothetical protein